ncbi:MAG: flagellar biogenesis protein [Tissierellia bacterium]|nr:flagellar biogenesis protein [Tissierellia bacterium]
MGENKRRKRKKAVALKYNEGYSAPRVIAKGKGEVAEKIIDKGKDTDIHIYEDEKLVEDLIKLELYDDIPKELYEAVAEIIFFVYSLDREKGANYEK